MCEESVRSNSFRSGGLGCLAVLLATLAASPAIASDINWDAGAGVDPNWSLPANWSGDALPGANDFVYVGSAGGVSPATAVLQDLTTQALELHIGNDPGTSGSLTISSGGVLNAGAISVGAGGQMDLGGTGTTTGSLAVAGGTVANGTIVASTFAIQSGAISATLSGGGNLTKTTSGTATLSGSSDYSGGTTVSVGTLVAAGATSLGAVTGNLAISQGATLQAMRISKNTLTVDGTATIAISTPNNLDATESEWHGDNPTVNRVRSLVMNKDGEGNYLGTLDLSNNVMVIDYTGGPSPIDEINAMAAAACSSGGGDPAWTVGGITSSFAIDRPGRFAIGVMDNAMLRSFGGGFGSGYNQPDANLPDYNPNGDNFPLFVGTTVVPKDVVLVKFTWLGDLNLDGYVGTTDYALLNLFRSRNDPNLVGWQYGDVNYDGVINDTDVNLMNDNWSTEEPQWKGLPEPGTLSLLAAGAAAMLARRRRGA